MFAQELSCAKLKRQTMSISSVGGASSSGGLSQMLAAMLSRLADTSEQQTASEASKADDSSKPIANNSLTGSDNSTLSDKVIGVLVMLQAQSQSGGQGSCDSNASTQTDPIQTAFSSMDTDRDGAISKSELEATIESAGGTSGQADTIYSALGGSDATGISKDQFASAAKSGALPPGGPPLGEGLGGKQGHHHGGSGELSSESLTKLFNTLDTDKDGTVSAAEFAASLDSTNSAGSSSDSSTTRTSSEIFSSMDSNGDKSISQDELTTYLKSPQDQTQTGQATLNAFASFGNRSYNSILDLLSSGTTSQSTYA
jgi:Ca2+-binding EF-hand superfamily protein